MAQSGVHSLVVPQRLSPVCQFSVRASGKPQCLRPRLYRRTLSLSESDTGHTIITCILSLTGAPMHAQEQAMRIQ